MISRLSWSLAALMSSVIAVMPPTLASAPGIGCTAARTRSTVAIAASLSGAVGSVPSISTRSPLTTGSADRADARRTGDGRPDLAAADAALADHHDRLALAGREVPGERLLAGDRRRLVGELVGLGQAVRVELEQAQRHRAEHGGGGDPDQSAAGGRSGRRAAA